MARIEVVILNWNGEKHLKRFLPSVVSGTDDYARITVADNGSTDGSLEYVVKQFPSVNIIRLGENYGFAGGYNKTLLSDNFSGAEYFVLLNSDVVTPQAWLEPLIAYLDTNPEAVAVSPKILSYAGKDSFEYAGASGGFLDILGYPFCRGRILSTVEKDCGQYDDSREVFWASGACMAVRADAFRQLGGFDERFFAHMEEIDFCWRAQLAGWKTAVVPRSFVYHLGGGTLQAGNPHKLYLNYRNNLYMLYKNLPPNRCGFTIRLRMLADGGSALVYLVTFRPKAFRAVWRAHKDFRKFKKAENLSTGKVPNAAKVPLLQLTGVYKGSIILRFICGKKKFGRLL